MTATDERGSRDPDSWWARITDMRVVIAAAIMLLGPEYDLTTAELHALGEHVVRAAERATTTAGGTSHVQRTAHE